MALGSIQPLVKMSTRNISGGKGGWCVGQTTSPLSRAECHEIWEPKPPGTLWATPGLLRDCFTFYSRTPLIRINWDDEPSGYAENPDNLIFSLKIGYIDSLKFGCMYRRLNLSTTPDLKFY